MGMGHLMTADVVAPRAKPRWWTFPRIQRYLAGFPPAGLTGALFFYCLSLTPSLLPRAWYLQAVMSAVTAAIGYGVGLFLGWVARSLISWRPSAVVRRWARWALVVAAVVLIPLFGFLGAEWQHQIREIVDASQPSEANYILVVVLTVLLTTLLILAARGIRAVVRAALGTANSIFGAADSGTTAGVNQPTTPMRSGSLDSLIPWNTLGRQGRTFVDSGPTAAMISQFTGQRALEPIRVYAGLESAPSIQAEAALVVRELDRMGAFNRKVLVVATTTGTGWVNPAMIDPLEYMYGGDTAVAAIQYSFLPSWISFIADKAPAQEAGRDLFDAVFAKWNQLPAAHQPKLVVFGESLGSFGGENAFSGTDDIRDRTSGSSGSARPTATPCGAGSRPSATTERPNGSRSSRAARPSASSRRPASSPRFQRTGPSRGSSTCRTRPIPSFGGPGPWHSTSPTGLMGRPCRALPRPCTGSRW
jgi:uncharacterized membrane protein